MRETQFVTFYSYKGGVGRTLALGNIAWEAALRGKRVVVIDFDLEAPGIPSLIPFHARVEEHLKDKNKKGGLFELILYFQKHKLVPSIPDFYSTEPIIDDGFEAGGEIYIVPAGYEDSNYKDKLQSFDWDKFYEQEDGAELFNGLRDEIKFQFDNPDLVLIDSRTGLTDIGGICTLLIPDKVVVLTGLNDQNISGCKAVIDTIEKYSGYREEEKFLKPIEIILVASHVPDGDELALYEERLKHAEKIFKRSIDVTLPYVAALSLEERLLIQLKGRKKEHSITLVERYLKLYSFLFEPYYEISAYCQRINSLYAHLPVAGFVTQLKVPIDIEEIYVPMRAMLNLSGQGTIFSDSCHAEKGLRDNDVGHEISLPVAFQEAHKRKRKGLVILGDPGSGKTTHLKRLLLGCIRKGSEALNLPLDMVPVFLPLRELEDLDLDHGLDLFIQKQLDSSHLNTPQGFGARLLQRGNLLFLLDGLDEVADLQQREKVASWVLKALPAHPTCRFVVTCRFAGYSPTVQMSEDFLEMHVRPFNGDEAEKFVRNWYKAVEQGLAKDTDQAGVIAEEKADRLLERLRESDFRTNKVFELTRNPLLLTNICLVHRHRNDLPHKRAKLYEECIDVLLEHWRKAKKLRVGGTSQDRRRVLQPAALWMHEKEGRICAKASELAPVIEPALKAIGSDDLDALNFLKDIRDDSGLLTGWDQEHYGFMHLGFQEYLVAREIRSRAFKDKVVLSDLAAHFGESWWQEVTLIMLALEDPSLFEDFMEEVVKLPTFASNPNLVDMCLEDAAETSVQPFMDILNEDPGNDEELWKRQAAALRVVKRLDESVLEAVKARLEKHPFVEISQKFKEYSHEESAQRNVVTAKQGEYELVRIPGGSFMMGSPESEKGRDDDEGPLHKVVVPEFYMGRFPVTNRQYGIFIAENSDISEPEYWADRRYNLPEQPVVGVSWDDAKRYADWAGLRLPTEAEWEYACRAGTTTRYYLGDEEGDLERAGWYKSNSSGQSHPVGEKAMNGFGLYDMHGNVWQWVEDDWHGNYNGAPNDGNAWVDNIISFHRVIRGGSWYFGAWRCRSAVRSRIVPDFRISSVGFRLSRSVALDP